ncbi:MAG: chromophore lyase CpcT/CpeT [Phycisphaerales bacterium]|nr:chromophore lyase CpcT/CpeT [Phycisphaerales bacterium]
MILLAMAACTSGPKVSRGKQKRKAIQTVKKWMVGTFNSHQQSKQAPGDFHDIRLVQVPIWEFRDDGPWLYVEQAHSDALNKPYRQRVYQLSIQSDGRIDSQVFDLPGNPLDYTAPWRGDGSLGGLHPDSLVPRPGCTVVFKKVDGNTFKGGIEGTGCPSDLSGATYLSSDVTLRSDRILVWDRGYGPQGQQVWGSTSGPYIFRRTSSRGPE